jgi:hypothetical protein
MSNQVFNAPQFQFSDQCLDWVFSNVCESSDEFDSDTDGWTLLKFLLSYVEDLNTPLVCGRSKGRTYFQAAVDAKNKQMVKLLLSNQHGSALNKPNVPIITDEVITKWFANNF